MLVKNSRAIINALTKQEGYLIYEFCINEHLIHLNIYYESKTNWGCTGSIYLYFFMPKK